LPAAVQMESFDSATPTTYFTPSNGAILSQDTVNKVEGVAALKIGPNNGQSASPAAARASVFNGDPNTMGTIAMRVDYGNDAEYRTSTGVNKTFGRSGSYPGTQAGITTTTASVATEGDRWECFHVSEVPGLTSMTAGQIDFRASTSHATPYCETLTIDSLCRNAGGRPTLILTGDDSRRDILTYLIPMLQVKCPPLVEELTTYVCTGLVGNPDNRLTWDENRYIGTLGVARSLNGTPDDVSMTAGVASPTAWVDIYNAMKTKMGVEGCAVAADMAQICYPFGNTRTPGTTIQGGATTRTVGQPTVTPAVVAGITVGMKVAGAGVPMTPPTTVVDVTGSVVTLSANITFGTNEPMSFTNVSGAWHTGKPWPIMRAAGVQTGRQTNPGLFYSRGGIGAYAQAMPALSFSQITAAEVITNLELCILRGCNLMAYFHTFVASNPGTLDMLMSEMELLADYLYAKWQANVLDFCTPAQLVARDGLATHSIL